MDGNSYAGALFARSRAAQKVVETYSQDRLDAIVRMFAKVVFDNAEPLAQLAVEESRMGVYTDKVAKNRSKSRLIWSDLKGKRTVGILAEYPELGLAEIAKPIGVVAAVTPCTNPVVTPMCNAMFSVKCGNSVIIAPHPRGTKTVARLAELYHAELRKMGAPEDLFLAIDQPTVELSAEAMSMADVVIATGGAGMVKAAYASGKPALGVGPGNVQCIFDRGVDYEEGIQKAIAGRIFDNGIICSSEQTVIVPEEDFDEVMKTAVRNGAFYIEGREDVDKIRAAVFPDGKMNRNLVGQSPAKILEAAGFEAPEGVKVIIVRPEGYGRQDDLSKEKMCPLMSAYSYKTWENAVDIACANLAVEGRGHSTAIHSHDKAHIEYAAGRLPVSRVVVNQVCSTNAGGAFMNGLNPTTTLGCGTWGNNSISENLTYYHLMNKTRIAYVKPGWKQPADDEIWG